MGFDMFCISRSRAGCKKPHGKILFLVEVMNFFKSGSQKNSNRDISKQLKDHFLRKPYKLEVLNLVVMFL